MEVVVTTGLLELYVVQSSSQIITTGKWPLKQWEITCFSWDYELSCVPLGLGCLLSIVIACVTARLSVAWSAVPARVLIQAGARSYAKWIQALCHRINILGSQLSPSSINLVPAQAGKVTVGLSSHWPCITDISGTTTYGNLRKGDEHPISAPVEYGTLTFTFTCRSPAEEHLSIASAHRSLCCRCRVASLR